MTTRDTLLAIFEAGVGAARPATCVPPHLPPPPAKGRVILLGTGKGGAAMVAAAEAHYLDHHGLPRHRIDGLAVCRHGYAVPTRVVPVMEAGHPVPDLAGLTAARLVLDRADGAGADDLVVALLSGGGSANWVAPAGAITLDEKRVLTKALQRAGATIDELNCVRKHVSRIKGGRLAARAAPARVVSLAISDVPRDDPSVIASGPTVPDPTTLGDARAVLVRYGVAVPASVAAVLADPANETPKPGDPAFVGAPYAVICRPADMLAAAVAAAERAGYRTLSLGPDVEGEAREVAAAHAALALAEGAKGGRVAILSGGELTVTVTGEGRGGPNQEYALGLALALRGAPGVSALAADTDGTDGGGGAATDPAGALVFPDTLARAAARGLDPALRLSHNDATGFFEPLGDLVAPGPTMTNVNDLRVILVDPA
jgi:hydroxypyruvate reductase